MSESFAGITVPEGEPGALQDAAGRFQSLGHALSGVSGEMRGARQLRELAVVLQSDWERLGLAR